MLGWRNKEAEAHECAPRTRWTDGSRGDGAADLLDGPRLRRPRRAPRGITPEAISLRHAPRGDGGIAGFGGGGGPCVYARDDGGSETALGQAGAGTVGMANAFALTVSCSTVNVIQVAWGPNSEPQPATVAIYADPNGDGDPSDVTVADLIVQATGVTASSNTDIFVNYPIPDTVLPFDFFVIAITQDIGDGEFPLAIDTTATQSSSWTLLGISDVDDPFQNNGFLNNLDNIGFAGNHMVRVAFSETAGDECEDCFNVVEGTHVGSTANATGSTGDDTSCATGDTIDVWYCYTASCDGTATASLCDGTDFDTTLAIFSACDGDELFCDDDGCGGVGVPSEISWGVTAGTAYYVRVSGWNGDTGSYTLNIACESTLVNDDCADALPIVDGLTAFNTNDATTDGPENPAGICNDFGSTQTANDIWFDYTAICDGELLVTTCEDLGGSAEYDSDLVLYDGHECPVDNDRLLGCNDDDPDNPCGTDSFHSTVRIPVVAGQAIKIRVGGWGANDRGPGVLLVDCSPPNDDCADALPIADGLNPYDTSGASTDGPVHAACQYDGQLYNDIWFDYTATCTGDLLVTTCTDLGGFAGYDTDLAVYEGTDCPVTDERLLGCNDDDSGNPCGQAPPWASTVVVPVIAGQSYKIRVGGFGPADAGPGELLIECTAVGPPPILNEIRIDQPGADNDEYIELAGTPGLSLDGYTVLVIGDGPGGSGEIEEAVDLTGSSIGASGLFLIAENDPVLGATPDLVVPLNLENSDNVTFVLVSGFTGAVGDDLDTNDDCSLDVMPWTSVADAIGLTEEPNPPSGTECVYGADLGFEDIGPDGPFVPGQVYRCVPDGTWRIGLFDPADGTDTPGAENLTCCLNTLTLIPQAPINPLGYEPGDEVTVELRMLACELVAGFQAFISFDTSELSFVSGSYTDVPFGQPIIDPIAAVGGDINLASGIDQTIGQMPVDGEHSLVTLVFTAEDSFCLPSGLAFRDNVPPTRLSDPAGNEVTVMLSTELPATCKGDTNFDGEVDVDDLMAVIMDWGNMDPCFTDTDGSGVVDVDDLIQVILFWGPCP